MSAIEPPGNGQNQSPADLPKRSSSTTPSAKAFQETLRQQQPSRASETRKPAQKTLPISRKGAGSASSSQADHKTQVVWARKTGKPSPHSRSNSLPPSSSNVRSAAKRRGMPPPPVLNSRGEEAAPPKALTKRQISLSGDDLSDQPLQDLIARFWEEVELEPDRYKPLSPNHALIDRFWSWTKIIKIDPGKKISHDDLLHLRECSYTNSLHLVGELPEVRARTIELLFSPRGRERVVWSELKEISFSKIPVSDTALQLISELPKLGKLSLLPGCDQFTVQGLYWLMEGPSPLTSCSMHPSSAIDLFAIEDFRKARPDVQLEIEPVIDPTIFDLAVDEASQRMQDPALTRKFVFLQKLIGKEAPLPETATIEWDPNAVSQFYRDQVQALETGANFDFENQSQWMYFEQFLQAYLNISRASGAVWKALIQMGFPTDIPREVTKVIDFLDSQQTAQVLDIETLEITYVSYSVAEKVKVLDFTDLKLTALPSFMNREWRGLKTILLKGTLVTELPDNFMKKCPRLETIEFPDQKQVLRAPSKEEMESKG